MTGYVIGMDGGGTKTEVLAADRNKNLLFCSQGGGINYNSGRKDRIDSNLQDLFQTLTENGFSKEACSAICIGAAGISNPLVREQILAQVRLAGYRCPAVVVGDMETAFAGALEQPYGMILIVGTGSICYGKDPEGNTYRTGGYGHLIDDEGSAYAIGRDILSAVVRARDGRLEPTILTELVFDHLNINTIEELVRYVYQPDRNKKEIAGLSVLIEKAQEAGDRAAGGIIKKCASNLLELAAPIIRRMDGEIHLAVSGSVLLKNKEILEEFTKQMNQSYPQVVVQKPFNNAAYGAVRIALASI
ncbi:N-acetylglucosamine kinase-like BadF-type ATPase [Anaerotaenia torta]|uniref:BadF/BadG/BcrA/BcrD ATPase family protein n=1 Tax=Anaerotaenia torta TaxID=433293 RepID=UPI003D1B7C7A